MLDPYVRPLIDPPLNWAGQILFKRGVSANAMTVFGFVLGICAIFLILNGTYLWAALLIALNRLADGLDGAIARQSGLSDFGGFLDIVCDFVIYAGIVFAFGVSHHAHLFWASLLVFSFIGPMVSFLAYAILAAKKGVTTVRQGKKTFYYLGGICEGTETATFLILFCLFPQAFGPLSVTFSILCWLTTVGRVYTTWVDFGKRSS